MTAATTTPALGSDLVAALCELTEIVADETADTGQYTYRYATLAGIMRAVRPILAAHHLVVSQTLVGDEATIAVQTVLLHSSGEQHASGWLVVKAPGTAQQIGSWVSYLRRYQLTALLGIAIEDDDGRSSSPAPSTPAARPAARVGPLSDAQRGLIMALFDRLGLEGPEHRDARLALTAELIGRDITSTNEVTPAEAGVLITELRGRVSRLEEDGYG